MKIKTILSSDKSLLRNIIEVNDELYDESKHGNLVHIDTYIDTYEEFNPILNAYIIHTKIKFTAIARDKIVPLLKK